MRDHDERYGDGWREVSRGRGWRGQDDDTQEGHSYASERRSFDPPYGDERTYGRQGQRGGAHGGSYEGESAGRYPRGGGSYGQGDYSRSAQRSPAREGYRYGDTGQAGHGGYDAGREHGAGGQGGYSGYGSSGQGSYGPGGFARGGYGASGYGGDYGQDIHRGGEYDRSGGEDAYDAEFDPDYLQWRRTQLASYDRDYHHWREAQARTHDDDYRRWRDERRQKFHDDFHGWRQSRAAAPGVGQTVDPAVRNIADGGQGRADLGSQEEKDEEANDGRPD